MQNQFYRVLDLLLEDEIVIGNSDEMVMQTTGLYAYIPMKYYNELVNVDGIKSLNNYLSTSFTKRELKSKFNYISKTCGESEDCINFKNVRNSKSIRIFFSRIPEDMSNCGRYIKKNYEVLKISSRKLSDAKDQFKIYGVNFPGQSVSEWVQLKENDISRLNNLKEKWNKYFEGSCNFQNIYENVPHGAIFSETGIIPKFAFKNIHT